MLLLKIRLGFIAVLTESCIDTCSITLTIWRARVQLINKNYMRRGCYTRDVWYVTRATCRNKLHLCPAGQRLNFTELWKTADYVLHGNTDQMQTFHRSAALKQICDVCKKSLTLPPDSCWSLVQLQELLKSFTATTRSAAGTRGGATQTRSWSPPAVKLWSPRQVLLSESKTSRSPPGGWLQHRSLTLEHGDKNTQLMYLFYNVLSKMLPVILGTYHTYHAIKTGLNIIID